MSDGNKTGLESTWSKVNTVIKHGMEESLEFFGVAFHNFFEAGRTSRAEVNAKHTAGALSGESNAFFFGNLNQTADEFGSLNGQSVVEARFLNGLQCSKTARIKVAPAVCFFGFIFMIYGIVRKPKDKTEVVNS